MEILAGCLLLLQYFSNSSLCVALPGSAKTRLLCTLLTYFICLHLCGFLRPLCANPTWTVSQTCVSDAFTLNHVFLPLSSLKGPNPGIFVRELFQTLNAFGQWFSPWSHARGVICLLHLWQIITVSWAVVLSFVLCFRREFLSLGTAEGWMLNSFPTGSRAVSKGEKLEEPGKSKDWF